MTLFVIVGPSGTGKNTLVNEVLKKKINLVRAISTTTRKARPEEVDSKDYYFVTKEEFMRRVYNENMLEWFEYCNHLYGTEKNSLKVVENMIKIIEVNGANAYREKGIKGVYIFITSDLEILKERLEKRGDKDIDLRLKTAKEELKEMQKYDYIIENNKDIESAVKKLLEIIDKHSE